MNNAKHTPGPWIIRYAKNITAIGTPKGEMQLSLHGVYNGLKPLSVDLHEWKANAALIAAAPVMYEAIYKLMLEAIHYRNTGAGEQFLTAAIEQAKNALAQAEAQS